MIKKIFIANRGEIAARVIRSCQEMGIRTVAVYSEPDRTAPHVLLADEAYALGGSLSGESYLRVDKILEAAQKSDSDAIHPGYGFLSENASFAESVTKAGLTWIGPPAEAIRTMGDKMQARVLAGRAKAPIIPGSEEGLESIEAAEKLCAEIGFPVLIKAAGGGGGKGMRIVNSASEVATAVERAQSEAATSFSDDRVYIEKYLEEPHHIEVQIFADNHGRVVSLGERECSVQRRFQKIIEESPSPFVHEELRQQLSDSAIAITRACDYRGAGTVEFLVDKHKNHYFLEMNTRLQVEHPVTEMVTGYDLVKEQIRIAEGKPLSFKQNDVKSVGHAVEVRVYAEDGFNNFAPSTGVVKVLRVPGGAGVRFDEGIRQGQTITPYYDPLLGKLVTWDRDRQSAVNRMLRAMSEFVVVGIQSNIPFCSRLMQHSSFYRGQYSTKTLEAILPELEEAQSKAEKSMELNAGMMAAIAASKNSEKKKPAVPKKQINNWKLVGRKGMGA